MPCEHDPFCLLFAFAELCTYSTPCCLQNGRVGLIASLLLAVLSHRLRMRRLPPIAGGEGSVVTARFVTREVHVVASVDVLGADGTVET